MDEEDFMRGSEACIQAGWVTDHDWVIDAEPTNGQIQMAHKGRTWYEIDVQGHTAHASTPWKGADRIAAMAEIHSWKSDMRFCTHRFTLIWEVPRSLSGRSPAVIVLCCARSL